MAHGANPVLFGAHERPIRSASKQRPRRSARASRLPAGGSLAAFDGLIGKILDTQGRDVLGSGDPLEAEMWASYLVGLFGDHPLIGEPDPVAAIGGRFVSVARRRHTPAARVALMALAAVTSGELARKATMSARGSGSPRSPLPAWAESIGRAEPTTAWRATDLCGDQDSVMVGFRYPDGAEHSIVVLVDHLLGGIAKDVGVLGPLDEVVALWRDTPDIELVEEPVETAAGRVAAAMDLTDMTLEAPVSEDYRDGAALVWARLGPVAIAPIGDDPLGPGEREALVRAFLGDPAGRGYADDPAAWFLLDVLVDYRCDVHARDPRRWSAGAALQFLLDFVPRKVTAANDNLARFPEVLRAWVPWAADRAGLPASIAAETLEAIDALDGDFRDALSDKARWGPAKTLAMGMLADGVDLTDIDAANTWITARNAAVLAGTRVRGAHDTVPEDEIGRRVAFG